jgi:hypothetical protein
MHRGYEKSDPWDALNVHMALGALRHCSCEMQHANMQCTHVVCWGVQKRCLPDTVAIHTIAGFMPPDSDTAMSVILPHEANELAVVALLL